MKETRLHITGPNSLGDRASECRSLGADTERVGSVFDVRPGDDTPVASEDGCPDMEVRVWSVGFVGGPDCRLIQLVVGHERS